MALAAIRGGADAMAEGFLEEQLKRIRDLTEQVSRVRPIHDLHEIQNHTSEGSARKRESHRAVRRDTARDSSRRRGR
jgi:hypothetical protein